MSDKLMSDSRSDASSHEDCWENLGSLLDCIQSAGDFAAMKRYQPAPNPVLKIGDCIIPLPLNTRDAELIKEHSRQAPFGKGNETVVDLEVRRTWELSLHDNVRILNPAWSSFMQTLIHELCEDKLGIVGSIEAHAHKLLLYEEGSFFKAHKDSQKEQGMVATLAVCLPSEHKGGEVFLSHAGQQRTFDTSDSSLFDTTALAWFSDVTHEVKSVRSGHRLVLTYNIIHKSGIEYSAAAFSQQLDAIDSALTRCRLDDSHTSKKMYPLDHMYSQADLSLRNMKGRDSAVCESLHRLCSQHGFYLLLGLLTKEEAKETDGYGEDQVEVTLSIDVIKGPHGGTLVGGFLFTESDLFKDPYCDRGEDDFEASEHLGNEESPDIYKYYDAVAIIYRKADLVAYVKVSQRLGHSTSTVDLNNIIQMVMKDIDENPNALGAPDDGLAVLEGIVDFYGHPRSPIYVRMVDWAWNNNFKHLFHKSVSSSLLHSNVLETVASIINSDIAEANDKTEVQWERYLEGAINKVKSLSNLACGLLEVEKRITESHRPAFSTWRTAMEQAKFHSKGSLDLNDEEFIILGLGRCDWLAECLAPALAARGQKRLVTHIVQRLLPEKSDAANSTTVQIASNVLQSTFSKIALDAVDFKPTDWRRAHDAAIYNFFNVLERCFVHGLQSIAAQLLDASWANMDACHKDEHSKPLTAYVENVEYFVGHWSGRLQKYDAVSQDSTRQLLTLLIRRYIYSRAPSCPVELTSWSFKPRGCGCSLCKELDKFLQAEDESERIFEFVEVSQPHISYRLPKTFFKVECNFGLEHKDLKVSKLPGKEFEESLREYRLRFDRFEATFANLRNDYMKELLGDTVYREIVMLEGLKASQGAKQLTSEVPTAANKRAADEMLEQPRAVRPRHD
ncbi:hypothetical protein F4808DRAFT_469332 [Astrocystis sublimbata]|nr:hypothetical protein F4808DRAFT_469332 [Astrocystis sublimbata]